jgi:hypothetical protein
MLVNLLRIFSFLLPKAFWFYLCQKKELSENFSNQTIYLGPTKSMGVDIILQHTKCVEKFCPYISLDKNS